MFFCQYFLQWDNKTIILNVQNFQRNVFPIIFIYYVLILSQNIFHYSYLVFKKIHYYNFTFSLKEKTSNSTQEFISLLNSNKSAFLILKENILEVFKSFSEVFQSLLLSARDKIIDLFLHYIIQLIKQFMHDWRIFSTTVTFNSSNQSERLSGL